MAEVAVINHATENFDAGSLCFEAGRGNNERFSDSTDSSRMHRKHRFTIFIGYGEEAGYVLKRCEQLKCKLGFSTNIQFFTYLIDFFEHYNVEDVNNFATVEISDDNNHEAETLSSYVYDVKCKTFKSTTNLNLQNKNETLSPDVILTSSNCEVQQNVSSDCKILQNASSNCTVQQNASSNCVVQQNVSSDCMVQQNVSSNCTVQQNVSSNCTVQQNDSSNCVVQPKVSSVYMVQQNVSSNCAVQQSGQLRLSSFDINSITNKQKHTNVAELCMFDEQGQNSHDIQDRKSSQFPSELGNDARHENTAMTSDITSPVKRKSEHMDENISIDCTAVSLNKLMCQPPSVVDAGIAKPGFDASLTLSDFNTKALKSIHQYMENIKNDISYCYGYISCAQKLKSFLEEYRRVTSTSFTVRSSRSYIKKRVPTAPKSSKNENIALNSGCVGCVTDQNENILTDGGIKLPNQISDECELKRNSFELTDPDEDCSNDLDGENIVTGPLRWEFILGKPPIPFTGVPFFIIGNTQYQCLYASADIRTQRRKEKIEQIRKENPDAKTRNRRSMKRDCKAVMCIKSIVTFPEFSIVDKMQSVNSKKGCRKLKATTLDNLREAVERGESIGHQSFWVHVPLPEAHSTHDILDTCMKVTDNNNSMDEIAQILQLAAYQYCGQEKSALCNENIAHVKLKDTKVIE